MAGSLEEAKGFTAGRISSPELGIVAACGRCFRA